MAARDVVVVGASAGGVEALRDLVSQLPADFPAAVLVVLHTPASARTALPQILSRSGPLPATLAEEGAPLEAGRIYVAPPDRHLIVYPGHVTLSRGPRENGHRPSVDVLFRSAARAVGARLVAVVLSGTLDDGAAGMVAVGARGGYRIVQDPQDAAFEGMPSAAIASDSPHAVVPVAHMGALLRDLVGTPVDDDDAASATPLMHQEVEMADGHDGDHGEEVRRTPPGRPSGFACPDCSGVLFEIEEGGIHRYRCRVGHAWSPLSLAAQQAVAVEGALWMALRALEEKASLADRMARGATARGHRLSSATFERQAEDARTAAAVLREMIEQAGDLDLDEDAGQAALERGVVSHGRSAAGAVGHVRSSEEVRPQPLR